MHGLKICGITDNETAQYCVEQGVGALGVVFFEASPRYVTPRQAAAIFAGVPQDVAKVGVCVNLSVDTMLELAAIAGLTTIQMHGTESFETMQAVRDADYRVIKVLKSSGKNLVNDAGNLPVCTGVMVELSTGNLPGGNGAGWDWKSAAVLRGQYEFALAGGLNADNLIEAKRTSGAVALDLSSAIESSPGVKDRAKIHSVCRQAAKLYLNRIFWRFTRCQ